MIIAITIYLIGVRVSRRRVTGGRAVHVGVSHTGALMRLQLMTTNKLQTKRTSHFTHLTLCLMGVHLPTRDELIVEATFPLYASALHFSVSLHRVTGNELTTRVTLNR